MDYAKGSKKDRDESVCPKYDARDTSGYHEGKCYSAILESAFIFTIHLGINQVHSRNL